MIRLLSINVFMSLTAREIIMWRQNENWMLVTIR